MKNLPFRIGVAAALCLIASPAAFAGDCMRLTQSAYNDYATVAYVDIKAPQNTARQTAIGATTHGYAFADIDDGSGQRLMRENDVLVDDGNRDRLLQTASLDLVRAPGSGGDFHDQVLLRKSEHAGEPAGKAGLTY